MLVYYAEARKGGFSWWRVMCNREVIIDFLPTPKIANDIAREMTLSQRPAL